MMSAFEVERITLADISKADVAAAKKESVSFHDDSRCEWYGIRDGGEVVSFTCLMIMGKVARFKSSFTRKEYRGRGMFNALHLFRIRRAISLGCEKATAICTSKSLPTHLVFGARLTGTGNSVAKWVQYTFKTKGK